MKVPVCDWDMNEAAHPYRRDPMLKLGNLEYQIIQPDYHRFDKGQDRRNPSRSIRRYSRVRVPRRVSVKSSRVLTMTSSPKIGSFPIMKGQGRLWDHLYPFVTLYACVGVAVQYIVRGSAKQKLGDYGIAKANQFNLQVKHPTGGLVEAALYGAPFDGFCLDVEAASDTSTPGEYNTSNFQDIVTNIISPIFGNYYETHSPWLSANIHTDPYRWPASWNFSRVIRNAVAHGGTINWLNPNAAAVQWHHLAYSTADRGKRVIGGDLVLGDFLILILEMDSELDRLGCPN
jgi:hypothetical protein